MLEDQILTAGTLILNLTLLPTLLHEKSKVSRWTSIPTSLILFVFAGVYVSLNLMLSAVAVAMGGMIWSLIAFYRS